MSSRGGVSAITDSNANDDPMDAFFREVQTIREMLDRIERCVKELYSSVFIPLLICRITEMQGLEDLRTDIHQSAICVRLRINQLQPEDTIDRSSAEARMRTIQHMTLSKKMVTIMDKYNRAQILYSDRCKSRLEEMLEEGNVSVSTDDIQTDAKQTHAAIEARHADLVKLKRSTRELHETSLDVAMLVENQGELMDSGRRCHAKAEDSLEARVLCSAL